MPVARRFPRSATLIAICAALAPAAVLAALVIGTSGPDVLEGTPDADTLDGKGGADTMMGLGGDDEYVVDRADDEVIEGAGEGNDTVRSPVTFTLPIFVENLILTGTAAVNGTGNDLNNRLTGNSGKNTLDGETGNDTMLGKDGDDTYLADSSGDVASEAADRGNDTVQSTATYRLRRNVENLVLKGDAAINGEGNEQDNSVTGNSAANVLEGKSGLDDLDGEEGNDRLLGGEGNDDLTGGPGQDTFEFDTALNDTTNVDHITDFSPVDDGMRLAGAVFPTLTTAGALQSSAFRAAAVAGDLSDRILYDPATGIVRYDPDGTGAAAAVRFVTLNAGLAVTNADFVVRNPVAAPVSFSAQIQPIFTANCISCHAGASAPRGLKLDSGNSFANLVNIASSEVPSLKRVKPSDPDNSYLVDKIEGTQTVGSRMPLNRPALSQANISLIRQWIIAGAKQ